MICHVGLRKQLNWYELFQSGLAGAQAAKIEEEHLRSWSAIKYFCLRSKGDVTLCESKATTTQGFTFILKYNHSVTAYT